MFLIAHEDVEAANASADALKALGAPARRVLSEVVEHSCVKRKQLSPAARDLESAGFLFIRDIGTLWQAEFEITPSLLGEEALEALEMRKLGT